MKRFILLLFLIIPIGIQAQTISVAILDFENISEEEKYDGLGKALSNMLISDLSQNIDRSKITFLERSQLNKLLEEQALQSTDAFDQNTAVTVGKLVGVDYVILGNVFILDQTSSFNSRMVNVETSEIVFSEETSGDISNWLTIKSDLAEKLSNSLNSPIQIQSAQSNQPVSEEVLTTYANAIESLDNENSAEAENLLNELKELQSDFAYVDDLSNDILLLQQQVEANTQRIDEISRSGGLILNPETLADYRNNLMSDRLSFEDRRDRRREMVSKFDVAYNDLFINELYNSVSDDVFEQEFRKDIDFIQSLTNTQKQLTFVRRLIDDALITDAGNNQWDSSKISRYDELWRLFYSIFNSNNQEPEVITEDDFAFIMLLDLRSRLTGSDYINYLTSGFENIVLNSNSIIDTQLLSEKLRATFSDNQLASQKSEILSLIERALSKQIAQTCLELELDCSSIGNVQSSLLRNAYTNNQSTIVPQFINNYSLSFLDRSDEVIFDEKTYLDLINKYELATVIATEDDRDRLYLESVQDKDSKIDYIHTALQQMEKELGTNGWLDNDFERYIGLLESKFLLNSASTDDEILEFDEYMLISLLDLGTNFPDEPMSNKDIFDISIYTDLLKTFYNRALYQKVDNIDHAYVIEIINNINLLDVDYDEIAYEDNIDVIVYALSKKLYSKCTSQSLNCVTDGYLNSVSLNRSNLNYSFIGSQIADHIYNEDERTYELDERYFRYTTNIQLQSELSGADGEFGDTYFNIQSLPVEDSQTFSETIDRYASKTLPNLESLIHNLQSPIIFHELVKVAQQDRSDLTIEELLSDQLDIGFRDYFEAYYNISEDVYSGNSNNNQYIKSELEGEKILDFNFTVNSSYQRRSNWIKKIFNDRGRTPFNLDAYINSINIDESYRAIPPASIMLTDVVPTGSLVQVEAQGSRSPSSSSRFSAKENYYFVLNSDDKSLGNDAYFLENNTLTTSRLKVFEIRDVHSTIADELIPSLNENYQTFIDKWKEAEAIAIQAQEEEQRRLEEYRMLKNRYREQLTFLSDEIEYDIVKEWLGEVLSKEDEGHIRYTTKNLFEGYIDWEGAFNFCYTQYSSPEDATAAELENILTLNIYLDVFLYTDEFSEQLAQIEMTGARVEDLEIVNKVNLVTGFIRYAYHYNKDMLLGLISLYETFDLNFDLESGWDMTVREMIELDISELVANGVISQQVESQVKSKL